MFYLCQLDGLGSFTVFTLLPFRFVNTCKYNLSFLQFEI